MLLFLKSLRRKFFATIADSKQIRPKKEAIFPAVPGVMRLVAKEKQMGNCNNEHIFIEGENASEGNGT